MLYDNQQAPLFHT